MAHMVLIADFFNAYTVLDSNDSYTIVPEDVAGPYSQVMNPDSAYSPCDRMKPYCEGKPVAVEFVTGWFARYSAPGYLDCTEWVGPFATEAEARKECEAIFDPTGAEDDTEAR